MHDLASVFVPEPLASRRVHDVHRVWQLVEAWGRDCLADHVWANEVTADLPALFLQGVARDARINAAHLKVFDSR